MVLDSDEVDLPLGALMEDAYLDEDDEDEDEQDEPTQTFKVEYGRIQRKTDELEAMRQAVDKILHTDRYTYQIYDEEYGNDLEELIGKPINYAESEVERITVEALTADDRITDVSIDSISIVDRDTLKVVGTCTTVYGTVPIETGVVIGESR